MKHLIWIAILLISLGIQAQDSGKLAGTIKDNEVPGEGVVFADVRLKEIDYKTQTNFRGNFEIGDVAPGNYTIEVSYLGYETLEIPVEIKKGELTRIGVVLSARSLSFDDLSSLQTKSGESNTSRVTDLEMESKR